ncbi:MAG TPA: zinc ribbon domain-containing protein [Longimicrobiales bacterium]|nr:zinc ribbon domain-containing protein [Longimicrobiales bacterium]
MATVQCSQCGTRSDGTFCPGCGTLLRPDACPECGATPPAGASFCTSCGTRLASDGAPAWLPWALAGLAVLALAVVAIVFMGDDGPAPARVNLSEPGRSAAPLGDGTGGGLAPLSGTPREQADRLFNRIMEAFSAADTPQAMQFLPMGIQAYQIAEPLDADGLYHLSLLQTLGGEPEEGRATAERVLSVDADHLLALAAAAEAAQAAGDPQVARGYWERFLEALPTQRESLPEYLQHEAILPDYEDQARSALGR